MSSVMLISVRPLASRGRQRDCLLSWLAVAITFDALNAADSRGANLEWCRSRKSTEYVFRAWHRDPLRVVGSAGVMRPLPSGTEKLQICEKVLRRASDL